MPPRYKLFEVASSKFRLFLIEPNKNALKRVLSGILPGWVVYNLVHLRMFFWNPPKALKNLDYDYKAVNLLKSEQLEEEYKCKQF